MQFAFMALPTGVGPAALVIRRDGPGTEETADLGWRWCVAQTTAFEDRHPVPCTSTVEPSGSATTTNLEHCLYALATPSVHQSFFRHRSYPSPMYVDRVLHAASLQILLAYSASSMHRLSHRPNYHAINTAMLSTHFPQLTITNIMLILRAHLIPKTALKNCALLHRVGSTSYTVRQHRTVDPIFHRSPRNL